MQSGTIVDVVIVFFLILQSFLGWRRGLLWQAAGVASMGFGVVLGWALSPLLSELFLEHVTSEPFHAKLAAFLLIMGTVGFSLRIAAAWAEVSAEAGVPRGVRDQRRADDRVLGGIFGAFKGCIITLLIIAACVSLYPKWAMWRESSLARPFAIAGSRLLPEGAVGEVKRWAGESVAEIRHGLNIN